MKKDRFVNIKLDDSSINTNIKERKKKTHTHTPLFPLEMQRKFVYIKKRSSQNEWRGGESSKYLHRCKQDSCFIDNLVESNWEVKQSHQKQDQNRYKKMTLCRVLVSRSLSISENLNLFNELLLLLPISSRTLHSLQLLRDMMLFQKSYILQLVVKSQQLKLIGDVMSEIYYTIHQFLCLTPWLFLLTDIY